MASAPRPVKRSAPVRCKLCGFVFPGGWFRLPNVPNSAMLLHHLGNHHLAEAKPYLQRMETECIDTVVMEIFERLQDVEVTAWLISRMSPEALRAAIDAALVSD